MDFIEDCVHDFSPLEQTDEPRKAGILREYCRMRRKRDFFIRIVAMWLLLDFPTSEGWSQLHLNLRRGDWIRTNDPLLPKQLRYQAALHPGIITRMVGYFILDSLRDRLNPSKADRVPFPFFHGFPPRSRYDILYNSYPRAA